MWLEQMAETVTVITHVQEGTDPFGAPTTQPQEKAVADVLVAPGATADLSEDRPEGVEVNYTLYFPKAFTGSLEGAEVVVRGERLRVIGHPDAFSAGCPTSWNQVVAVGGSHG